MVTKVLENFGMPIVLFVKKNKTKGTIAANKEKLLTNAKLEDLLGNWDVSGISKEILDLAGCVIPVGGKDIYVGLNSRKYLQRQYERSNKFHEEKEVAPQKGTDNVFLC